MKEFDLQFMTCSHCVNVVTKAVKSADPDAKIEVDLPNHKVSVETEVDRETVVAATNPHDREPVAPVLALSGLVVFGLPRLHYAGLRNREPFIVPMRRITVMTTSAFRHTGYRCSGQRMSIRSSEMPSRRFCLPIELRKTARKP